MHNFSVPAVVKLWLDQVVFAGKTFAYIDGAPRGLLKNKNAQFFIASGGSYSPGSPLADFVEPYLRTIFGFMGVTDASFHIAGGVAAIGPGKIDRQTFLQPTSIPSGRSFNRRNFQGSGLQSDKENFMKIASTIARYLLGVMFTIFGLNGFLQFMPLMPMPPLAGQFLGVLVASHYVVPVFLIQIASGLLFLANRYVPLALTLIGPVIANILIFHVLMDPGGIGPGAIATVCWLVVFYSVRPAFAGIFRR